MYKNKCPQNLVEKYIKLILGQDINAKICYKGGRQQSCTLKYCPFYNGFLLNSEINGFHSITKVKEHYYKTFGLTLISL